MIKLHKIVDSGNAIAENFRAKVVQLIFFIENISINMQKKAAKMFFSSNTISTKRIIIMYASLLVGL